MSTYHLKVKTWMNIISHVLISILHDHERPGCKPVDSPEHMAEQLVSFAVPTYACAIVTCNKFMFSIPYHVSRPLLTNFIATVMRNFPLVIHAHL